MLAHLFEITVTLVAIGGIYGLMQICVMYYQNKDFHEKLGKTVMFDDDEEK